MNRATIGLAFALSVLAVTVHGQVTAFHFRREIRLPDLDPDELVAIQLDEAVYRETADDLSDIRILDEKGEPVPFLLKRVQTMRERTTRTSWTGRNPAVLPIADDGLEITLELDEDDPSPDGIRVVSPLRDFEQRVRIYASHDGQEWEPRGSETVIFDYSRYMDVRSDVVAFPASDHRQYRVVIDAVTSRQESQLLELTRHLRAGQEAGREERVTVRRRPFRIERIEFWQEHVRGRSIGDAKTLYATGDIHVEQDAEQQRTLILVASPRAPLTSLQLVASTRNFSRRVGVEVEEVRGPQTSWRTLADAVLSRLDFKDLQREDLRISFPESRRARYRVVVQNRDSPPLEISGIQSEGNVYQLLFLSSSKGSYRLAYGAPGAERPEYDTAAIRAVLEAGFDPARAELGEPSRLDVTTREVAWTDLLLDSRVLVGMILFLVVVLGVALYSAVRRLEDLPKEGKGQ